MEKVEQGDIIRITGFSQPVIVVSNNYFNFKTGSIIVCPIVKSAEESPLHVTLETEQTNGVILCEQVHYIHLKNRHYSKISSTEFFFVMDISDIVMGMFDYQAFSA